MGISKSKNYLNYLQGSISGLILRGPILNMDMHDAKNIKVPCAKVTAISECNHVKKITGKQ